jgi:1-acyl-sn-glycerol-3-phosphate acyltransferase
VRETILEKRQSISVFPAGTTTIGETAIWRYGAFRIAHEHGIPVQRFEVTYEPLREAAYVGRIPFAVHALRLLKLGEVTARIRFHPPTMIKEPEKDCLNLWQETQAGLSQLFEPKAI